MKAEREEVKLRRRSKSFVGGVNDKHKKEAKQLRRRSSLFHRGSLKITGGEGREERLSTTSLSTPVSPVISEDEQESPEDEHAEQRTGQIVVGQVGGAIANEETRSLEFSLSLDDGALDSSMSQPEPTSTDVSPSNTTGLEELQNHRSARIHKRSSQKSIHVFHSTPVKDANGYIRPLYAPFPRELDFETSMSGHGYDEPDFSEKFNVATMKQDNVGHPALDQQAKSSDEDNFRMKIPSISLQKTSSHSSLEDWEEGTATKAAPEVRKMGKSQSFESPLVLSMNGHEQENTQNDGDNSRLNRLTLSHSIPSLDSDSVFSIEDEGEEEDGGEEGGRRRREMEETVDKKPGEESLFLEQSLDSEISTEDASNIVTRSLPASTFANITSSTATPQGVPRERDTLFGPEMSLSPEQFVHSRDQSFNTVESTSVVAGQSHGVRQAFSSRIGTSNPTQDKTETRQQVSSTDTTANTDKHSKNRQHSNTVHRSKSASSSTNYRHKWRWKKAVALTKTTTTNSTNRNYSTVLNNANPFHLLSLYQLRSSDCLFTDSRVDFRTFLDRFSNNTETRNYELSFEREP